MQAAMKQPIEIFASQLLKKFICHADINFIISALAPDVVWVDAEEKRTAKGAEAVRDILQNANKEPAPCPIWNETHTIRALDETHYLCVSEIHIETEPRIKKTHNVTFIFEQSGNALQVAHMHSSVSHIEHGSDVSCPRKKKDSYAELQSRLTRQDRQIDLMLSQLPGGMEVFRLDEHYSTEWASPSLCNMLGYADAEEYAAVTGNCGQGFIFPEDYAVMRRQLRQSFQRGDSYNVEYRAIKKDKSILWVSELGKKVRDSNGDEIIYCFITDITERKSQELHLKKTNQEIKQQKDFLTQLYNTIPCGILQFVMEEDSAKILHANRMAWEIYGYTEQEYLYQIKNPFQFVLKEDFPYVHSIVKTLTLSSGKTSYTRESRRKDGSACWINVVLERVLNADGIEVIQAMFTDISETKKLQTEREQEQLLENRSLRAAICTAYPLIININLTQNTYACFIEEDFITHVDARGSFDKLLETAISCTYASYREEFSATFSRKQLLQHFSSQREIYREIRQLGDDGLYHWVAAHLIHVDNPYNDDVLAVLLLKTLDEQHAEKAHHEQILRDALATARAANNAKSDFLSRMSHDIRTPMNAIIGMSAIGQLQADNPTRIKDCFQKIDTSSRYLLSLINDILDMAKIESGKMTLAHIKFDLKEFIEEFNAIVYPQTVSHQISFELLHDEPLERYYLGDALRLKQVLMNLISNALKFTPAGGTVRMHIAQTRRANKFSYLRFCVSDTGIGISKDFLEKIFQPFEQETSEYARNNIGSGLGLSIVYNLVQLMGGTTEVQSEKGHGATFTITVPLELTDDDEMETTRQKSRELLKGQHVLIVDDDKFIGEQTADLLSALGASFHWVDSGFKAIEAVEKTLKENQAIDIAMIDWKMPRMGGLETTKRIRELVGPHTLIVIITAYDWTHIEAEARAAGADGFITKPLFHSTVYDTFLNLMTSRKEQDTVPEMLFRFQEQRILLVEDNELNLEIAKSLLEMQNLTVDTAENGEIAVEKFNQSPQDYYLAILMDIRMPVMDGLQATKIIRSLARPDAVHCPIIAMTANAFEEDRMAALEIGMTSYLVKPIDIHLLIEELRKFIRLTP